MALFTINIAPKQHYIKKCCLSLQQTQRQGVATNLKARWCKHLNILQTVDENHAGTLIINLMSKV